MIEFCRDKGGYIGMTYNEDLNVNITTRLKDLHLSEAEDEEDINVHVPWQIKDV